ncbi:MAG: VRR-NUC domain-containing protein [Clostridia bacterium]|nr:VRR-NUC domain-containing protein [Clostridia bacterium]
MLEKYITNKILKYLRSLEYCYCFKEYGGSYGSSGIPDIICCYHGYFVAFEVKTAKGRTTALQDVSIRNINKAGGRAVVVRSVDEVKAVLEELDTKRSIAIGGKKI